MQGFGHRNTSEPKGASLDLLHLVVRQQADLRMIERLITIETRPPQAWAINAHDTSCRECPFPDSHGHNRLTDRLVVGIEQTHTQFERGQRALTRSIHSDRSLCQRFIKGNVADHLLQEMPIGDLNEDLVKDANRRDAGIGPEVSAPIATSSLFQKLVRMAVQHQAVFETKRTIYLDSQRQLARV